MAVVSPTEWWSGSRGVIDRAGNYIIQPKYYDIFIVKGVIFAKEERNGLFGILDKNGKWIAFPQFNRVDRFF